MKVEVSQGRLAMLDASINKMLMTPSREMIALKGYGMVEQQVRIGWFRRRTVTKTYITGVTIIGYNSDGRFMGVLTKTCCYKYLTYVNLYQLRGNWIDFVEELRAFGFKLERTES